MNLKATLRHLYLGHNPASERFRYGLMTFDIVTICFFIVSSMLPEARWILLLDAAIGVVLLFDFWARFVVATKKVALFPEPGHARRRGRHPDAVRRRLRREFGFPPESFGRCA